MLKCFCKTSGTLCARVSSVMAMEALSWNLKELDFGFLEQKTQIFFHLRLLELCNPHIYEYKGGKYQCLKGIVNLVFDFPFYS